ncbi:MAG: hypothetical protein COV01_01915 [Candidatus Taylorbacteria bacterium CG10_big_fil_rev_8_21_14_0_10_41_48]|uniref:Uncharacterized protein n=1 Tax=Candidatus Taylorbacteria bacterium CG10_big_fil_rev_8_21_14_0_10_41_48 TaxID=1975024 RepID=A0A2M8LCE8_9BACT|nr:MAG: hypothetical protein COV01_01915 [Candidatus Taylorbacteria bacterium CG10_big_fil_rev_8_21_14_0_10_41_48]
MILEITIISIALVVLIVLFVHKYLEQVRGAHPKIVDVRNKADVQVETAVKHAEMAVSSITLHNTVLVANGTFVWIARFFLHIFSTIGRAFHHIVERGSRRQESLKQGGAASFYLKQIKENKDSSQQVTDSKE